MTNTADDLLRRALEVLEAAGALGFGHPPIGKEIRAYLDAPKDDPVLCKMCGKPTMHIGDVCYGCSHPPTKTAQRKPMTEEAEDEAFNSASKYAAWLETENRILREARKPMTEEEIDEELETNEYYCAGSFAEGVRYAERFHGITDVRE